MVASQGLFKKQALSRWICPFGERVVGECCGSIPNRFSQSNLRNHTRIGVHDGDLRCPVFRWCRVQQYQDRLQQTLEALDSNVVSAAGGTVPGIAVRVPSQTGVLNDCLAEPRFPKLCRNRQSQRFNDVDEGLFRLRLSIRDTANRPSDGLCNESAKCLFPPTRQRS